MNFEAELETEEEKNRREAAGRFGFTLDEMLRRLRSFFPIGDKAEKVKATRKEARCKREMAKKRRQKSVQVRRSSGSPSRKIDRRRNTTKNLAAVSGIN